MSITLNIPVKRKVYYPDLLINVEETANIDVTFDYVNAVINTDGSESSANFTTSLSGVDGVGNMQVAFLYKDSSDSIQSQAEAELKEALS